MKVQLVAVGSKMPAWVQQGYQEFSKRLPGDLTPRLVEVPLAPRHKNTDPAKACEQEGQAILAAIPRGQVKIMLDLKGQAWSTEDLARQLAKWRMDGADLSFVIGGPDGLSEACRQAADVKWSLSNLTLPHPLVRVVFIEQLYRAWSLLQNHPYHK